MTELDRSVSSRRPTGPFGGAAALTHREDGADEAADHRPAEGVGAHVGGEQVAVAFPIETLEFADGGGALASAAERGEVVQAQQVS